MQLKEIDLYITEKCNLSCPFCSIQASANSVKELDYDTVTRFVDFCKDNNVTDIHITGGEPTLHKNYKEIIRYVVESGIDVRLITNGLLISKADLIELRDIGLEKIMISLDGLEDFHDSVRKKGAFKKTLSTISNAIELGFNVRVNAVAWMQNLTDIPQLMNILDGYSVNVFSVFLGSPVGRAKNQESLTVVGPQVWINFLASLRSFYALKKMKIKVVVEQGYLETYKDSSHTSLRSCTSIIQNTDYLSIRADGNVYPCVFFSNDFQSLGNIHNPDAIDFQKALEMSKFYNQVATLPTECEVCESVKYCQGGCRGFNYSTMTIGRDLRCNHHGYIPICPLIKINLFTDEMAACTDDLLG